MKKLTKGPKRFYEFMRKQSVGSLLTLDKILSQSGWSEVSFRTYKTKNILRPFLAATDDGRWRVLKDGSTLEESAVANAFTQARAKEVVLSKGDVLPGEKKRTYQLISQIGAGAVGQVWKALSNGKFFAVKAMVPRLDLLNPTTIANVEERFRRESKNGQKLSNTNVVKYLDRGEWSGAPFLVMELAEKSVGDLLGTGKSMSVRRSSGIIVSCCRGLAYLHSLGCVHRDVKPPNILLEGDRVVLGDLGIVNWGDMNPEFTGAATITKASIQLGSWFYMAPEQLADAHHATAASDVYALGVTWYELLTGTTPPPPPTFAAQKQPNPTTDKAVTDLINRMVSYDPSARPTIEEITELAALRAKA